jgi:hypothetical protein
MKKKSYEYHRNIVTRNSCIDQDSITICALKDTDKNISYFGISVLFLDLFDFLPSPSLLIFLIGEAVNFIASVTGGLSFRSSLLLLQYFIR